MSDDVSWETKVDYMIFMATYAILTLAIVSVGMALK